MTRARAARARGGTRPATVEGLSYAIHCRGGDRRDRHRRRAPRRERRTPTGEGSSSSARSTSAPATALLAWSADVTGGEEFTLRIRDLATGIDLPDRLERTYYGTAWSADERYLFYSVPDHAMRPHQVWRHELGTAQADDVLVYEEPDERFNLGGESSPAAATTSSSRTRPTPRPRCWCSPPTIRSGHRARGPERSRRRVPPGPLGRPVRDPHEPRRAGLQGGDRAAARRPGWTTGRTSSRTRPAGGSRRSSRSPATSSSTSGPTRVERIRILGPTGRERTLGFDEPVYSVASAPTPSTTPARCASPTSRWSPRPPCSRTMSSPATAGCSSARPVLGGYDPADYDQAREWATAPDGAHVPIDVVWRRTTPPRRHRPRSPLYGYGAYEHLRARSGSRWLACRSSIGGGVGPGPSPGRRRARPPLVPRRQAPGQAEHVHRLHRLRGASRG